MYLWEESQKFEFLWKNIFNFIQFLELALSAQG